MRNSKKRASVLRESGMARTRLPAHAHRPVRWLCLAWWLCMWYAACFQDFVSTHIHAARYMVDLRASTS